MLFHSLPFKFNLKTIKYFLFIFSFIILSFLFAYYFEYECPFRKFFHIWCSGCGGTRMVISLIQGDFYQSFRYNPLLFLFLVIGVVFFFIEIYIYQKKKKILIPSLKVWLIIFGIFVLYMIIRNIPGFGYLIPTEV